MIIVLGHTNDIKGNLSSIAKERLNLAFKKYQKGSVIVTGGFGDYFNKTKTPHAFYSKAYLINKGIDKDKIITLIESCGTIEDLSFSKNLAKGDLTIITSDFHLKRVKYIAERVLKNYKLTFRASKTKLPSNELKKLNEHEKKSFS